MIFVDEFIKELKNNKISFFSGVPDSVLKNFTNELDHSRNFENYILSNEGSAVATGIGYYLATKKIPAIYMQNSGLGNSLNPIISIAHKKVYKIPMLLIIGWRENSHNNLLSSYNSKTCFDQRSQFSSMKI